MFGELIENVTIENPRKKDIEFSTERFNQVSEDFDRFTQKLVNENDIDPDNLGPTWSGRREVSITEVKARYILALYANLETRDQLLSNKEPKILEVGSYMTGLIPAMYLSSKGLKPEVMDTFPVKEYFPKLSRIAEEKYGVKIHKNDIEELPEAFKDAYDMVYIQSFPPGRENADMLATKVYTVLKDNGMCLVNDGGHFDMFSTFPPHFTEEMGLKWRYIAKRLNIGKYEDSRIAVLRKNTELEKIIFYLKKDYGKFAWPIAKYNFVIKDYSENHNIDIEKFTRGHVYSLALQDNENELPAMQEEDFDFSKVSGARRLIYYMYNWMSSKLEYLPREIHRIIQEYELRFKDFDTFSLSTPQRYMLFRHSWLSEMKAPIERLVRSKEEYQEDIIYYEEVCKQSDREWVEYLEKTKSEEGLLR